MSIFQQLLSRLDVADRNYDIEHHDAIVSSEQTSHERGMDLHAGAKAIVVTGRSSGTNYLFVLPGDFKVDNQKAKSVVGEPVDFTENVMVVTNCVPGSIPPFGSLFNLKTYCDPRLGENEIIFFNAGTLTDTIKMRFEDFIAIEKPVLVEIGKSPLDKLGE